MTDIQAKILAGTIAGVIWLLAVISKHFWGDMDIGGITTACGSVISGLGVYHATTTRGSIPPDTKGEN